MTAASAHCRQKHRKTALSILKKTLGAGTVLVPYPHCPWCSPVCEIVFFFFLKQPLQALVLLCFCIRIQATFKNISPRVQIKSLIIFDQCLSSSALGWYLASPQAAMSQRAFLVCGVARGNRAGDVTANRRNM